VTIVLNANTGELLHFTTGKKKESLDSFFMKLTRKQKSSIEIVGIDRAGSYLSSIKENLPLRAVVFDRFHIIQNINQAIDIIRCTAVAKASKEDKKVIKGGRYLSLSDPSELTESGKTKLENLIEANEEISIAYLLKEQFQRVHQRPTMMWAMEELEAWCDLAASSDIKAFQPLSRCFMRGAEKIVNYAKYNLTSGRIEGTNSLISKLFSKARGIKDLDYMHLRLCYASIMRI